MANPACIVTGRCACAAIRRGSNRQATRQLHAAAITSVTRLINWNQWRVEVILQRVQTDCTGRNWSPQFSQNKRASQREIRTISDYLSRKQMGYCTSEQVCRIHHLVTAA